MAAKRFEVTWDRLLTYWKPPKRAECQRNNCVNPPGRLHVRGLSWWCPLLLMRSCILQVTRIKCKRKADEDVGSRPSKILRQCLTDESTTIMTKQDLRNLSRCVHRVRRQKYPPAPRDFVELHIAVDKLDTVTCRGEQFCLLNDIPTHTLIFTCNSNLEVLCNDGAEIFADGTFKACVNLYEQLYIIHACVNGHYLPGSLLYFAC